MSFENYRIITIQPNPHIDSQIAEAIHAGFLWVNAVPRQVVAGFDSSPHPQHLIFSDRMLSKSEAQQVYDYWLASQGS